MSDSKRRLEEDPRLARRQILVRGEIVDETANEVIAKMLYLQFSDRTAPLTLQIDSPGGSVTAGLAIMDTMDFLSPPVHTHCLGEAHSLAALILAHGAAGQRTAIPEAMLSVSMPWGVSEADPAVRDAEIARVTNILLEFASRDTGKPANEVRADFEAESRFDASEAVSYGLIDRVETGPPGRAMV